MDGGPCAPCSGSVCVLIRAQLCEPGPWYGGGDTGALGLSGAAGTRWDLAWLVSFPRTRCPLAGASCCVPEAQPVLSSPLPQCPWVGDHQKALTPGATELLILQVPHPAVVACRGLGQGPARAQPGFRLNLLLSFQGRGWGGQRTDHRCSSRTAPWRAPVPSFSRWAAVGNGHPSFPGLPQRVAVLSWSPGLPTPPRWMPSGLCWSLWTEASPPSV